MLAQQAVEPFKLVLACAIHQRADRKATVLLFCYGLLRAR